MTKIELPAYAKINLTLDVLGRTENGYHLIDTVMTRIDLSDTVAIERQPHRITLSTDCPGLPSGAENLAYRAAELFFSHIPGGASIFIQKRIPVCAGLAGGSADTAAVLCGLNTLYGKPFQMDELSFMAAALGSDVPYCLGRSAARGRHFGEELSEIETTLRFPVAVVKPSFGISTKEAYQKIDAVTPQCRPDTEGACRALERGNLRELASCMANVLEEAAVSYPAIGEIKRKLREYGAITAMMSGSGSAVFGIFSDYARAVTVADKFRRDGYFSVAAMTLANTD